MNKLGYFFRPEMTQQGFVSHCQWSEENSMLSPVECRELIRMGNEDLDMKPAMIGEGNHGRVDANYRCVDAAPIPISKAMMWLYERVTNRVQLANDHYFGFDLTGLSEEFQLLRYTAPQTSDAIAGHYDWHQDFGAGAMSTRKLSVVINLSDPEAYDGCDLHLMTHIEERMPYKAQGEGVMFPTWTPHRVTDITRGVRYAMVAWVHGPRFR